MCPLTNEMPSLSTKDITALTKEIRISNENQERLLSHLKDVIETKNSITENSLNMSLNSLSDQDIESCNKAAKLFSDSVTAYKNNPNRVAHILSLAYGSEFSYRIFQGWNYKYNSPVLQIPHGNNITKLRWFSKAEHSEDDEKKVVEGWENEKESWENIPLNELGYDRTGYPMDDLNNEESDKYPNPFGVLRIVIASDNFLDKLRLTTILATLVPILDPSKPMSLGGIAKQSWIVIQSLMFIMAFSGSWSGVGNLGVSCQSAMDYDSASRIVHIQHHIRVLRIVGDDSIKKAGDNVFGINCERMRTTLAFVNSSLLVERRASLALQTTSMLKLPVFSMVSLEGISEQSPSLFDVLIDSKSWATANIRLGKYYRGLSIFQIALHTMLINWFKEWSTTLDEIDHLVEVQPTDLSDTYKMDDLMFDESLNKSRRYFVVLQTLRIIGDWISEALKDVEQQKTTWDRGRYRRKLDRDIVIPDQDFEPDENVIGTNWEALVSFQQVKERLLLDRVDRKIEEVKSLRDGLFNAISVREAQKGTSINQYLFVFTVVTIFYLPLSFVATIFGMHLFDYDDTHKTQTSFYISTVLISIITYMLSGVAAWWVGNSPRRQKLKLA